VKNEKKKGIQLAGIMVDGNGADDFDYFPDGAGFG
jgi:hypothetical protein